MARVRLFIVVVERRGVFDFIGEWWWRAAGGGGGAHDLMMHGAWWCLSISRSRFSTSRNDDSAFTEITMPRVGNVGNCALMAILYFNI